MNFNFYSIYKDFRSKGAAKGGTPYSRSGNGSADPIENMERGSRSAASILSTERERERSSIWKVRFIYIYILQSRVLPS